MSGAYKDKVEIREQSIKGLLRWWFRFYKGGILSLEELREIEGKIWGLQELASRIKLKIKNKPSNNPIDAYLRMNDKSNPNIKRKAFPENGNFEVEFRFSNPFDENIVKKELEETIWFLINFGGLGARWRRAFGSVQLDNEERNFDDIFQEVENKLSSYSRGFKNSDFMNISNTAIYFITKKDGSLWSSWENCMNDLRDNFYRRLKKELGINKIQLGRTSPLIIQIKRAKEGYYGVILIWKRSERVYEKLKPSSEFWKDKNFKTKEVLK
jgi:CRISPR-associated protein Cmr1